MHPRHLAFCRMAEHGCLSSLEVKAKTSLTRRRWRLIKEHLKRDSPAEKKLFDNEDGGKDSFGIFAKRDSGATAKIPGEPDNHEGWEDSAVPPEKARRLPA